MQGSPARPITPAKEISSPLEAKTSVALPTAAAQDAQESSGIATEPQTTVHGAHPVPPPLPPRSDHSDEGQKVETKDSSEPSAVSGELDEKQLRPREDKSAKQAGAEPEAESDAGPGPYVSDATWEERTWKEIVRLREDMFWARVGGLRV